jgi:uroporphyrinogen decarboxylase
VLFEPRQYRPGVLSDGSGCEFPDKWRPEMLADGSEVVRDESGTVIAARPKDGLYFDPVDSPLANCESTADIEKHKDVFKRFDWPSFADQTLEEMGQVAKDLYENTDYLVFGNFPGHIYAGAQQVRGYANFLIDLLANPDIARSIMQNLAEAFMERFDRYAETVGPYVQVISVNDDLGSQEAPQISPDLYRKMIKPYHSMLYQHMKKKWPGRLFLHSDGAISPLIPDLIEAGVDILNPVQYSAKGMELSWLKKTFGRDLVFWGGGCDTQKMLPLGTPQQIRDEVRRNIDQLAPGGGFVFCQVHNILADVPPENIAATYEAVAEYGGH